MAHYDHWSARSRPFNPVEATVRTMRSLIAQALLEAGISEDDVKIVIVKTVFPNEDHAMVATRVEVGDVVDNRTLTLVRNTDITSEPSTPYDQSGC